MREKKARTDIQWWLYEERGGMRLNPEWMQPLLYLYNELQWDENDIATNESTKSRDDQRQIWRSILKAASDRRIHEGAPTPGEMAITVALTWALMPTSRDVGMRRKIPGMAEETRRPGLVIVQ